MTELSDDQTTEDRHLEPIVPDYGGANVRGIIPAILSVTGLVMWWRSRGWKQALTRRRKEKARGDPAPQPAE